MLTLFLDCGELSPGETGEIEKTDDGTGDKYEDFPDDTDEELSAAKALEIATEIKEIGNKVFKGGDLELGIEKYQKALRYIAMWTRMTSEDGDEQLIKDMNNLRFTLHSNSSLLQSKQKAYKDAEDSASKALEVDGLGDKDRGKGYYRRAVARLGLKQEDTATADLEEAIKLVPDDAGVKKQYDGIKSLQNQRAEREKKAYQNMFK